MWAQTLHGVLASCPYISLVWPLLSTPKALPTRRTFFHCLVGSPPGVAVYNSSLFLAHTETLSHPISKPAVGFSSFISCSRELPWSHRNKLRARCSGMVMGHICAAYLCPLDLPWLVTWCIITIVRWIAGGPTQSYDLVDLTASSSKWVLLVTQPLGDLCQDPVSCQELLYEWYIVLCYKCMVLIQDPRGLCGNFLFCLEKYSSWFL